MKLKSAATALVTCLGLSVFANNAQADWYFVHGHSGHVEQMPGGGSSFAAKAGGLEVKPDFDESTWIHYSVPTNAETTYGVRYIQLKFNVLQAIDSHISHVNIYNGDLLVKSFPVNWNTPGYQFKTLDLKQIKTFARGLGVSIEINASFDAGSDVYSFIGVGADVVPKL